MTAEDRAAWRWACFNFGAFSRALMSRTLSHGWELAHVSSRQDARDAELMLTCRALRDLHLPVDVPPLRVRTFTRDTIDCGGAIMLPGRPQDSDKFA